jgi:uncharacterized membrane protein
MSEGALMIVLRLIHIIGGVFWVGTVMLLAWFVGPAQRSMGGATSVEFLEQLMRRQKLRVYLSVAMGLTVLSGLTMYTRFAMTTHGQWASTTPAKVLGFGALCGIIGGAIGASSGARRGAKIVAIGDAMRSTGGALTAGQELELDDLQNKTARELKLVAALLVIAVAAMASARYL